MKKPTLLLNNVGLLEELPNYCPVFCIINWTALLCNFAVTTATGQVFT